MTKPPLLAFYGDDFTGSTDALECLAAAGLRTVLFTDVPSPEILARFEGLEAVGIAGNSRSLTPAEMDETMPRALRALRQTGAPLLHYKVCSTFDSSPEIGSCGRVMDIAAREIGSRPIPIVVGAPTLGRYSMFGTLFARSNTDGAVYQIDRHPVMSRHPTTPMAEADMRLHIGRQTGQRIALLPAPAIAPSAEAARRALAEQLTTTPDAIVIDIADEPAEARVGLLLDEMAAESGSLFVLGSSGVEYAMVARWRAEGRLPAEIRMPAATPVDRLFVISGSCSPVNGAQIRAAVEAGFAEIALDPVEIVRSGETGPAASGAADHAIALLEAGRSVIVHSSTGPDDPREAAVASEFAQSTLSESEARVQGGRRLAKTAARILERVLQRVDLERFVVAGGDTSTAAIGRLGLDALEMVAPMAPGAPLCRVLAPGKRLDGVEVVLKGGQVGGRDLFRDAKGNRC